MSIAPRRCACRALLCAAVALSAANARAAHPFITEDPGTQGAGNVGLELGFAAGTANPNVNGRIAAFSPQLTIGVTPSLDFIGQGVWQRQTSSDAPTLFGDGDTVADFKWRFYEGDVWTFAVRAGLDLPTGDSTSGLGSGGLGAHAIAIAGLKFGAYSIYANAVYAHTRAADSRANLGAFSIALTQTESAPWQSFIEAATYVNPDPASRQWPAVARVGIQARLNASAPRALWLAGATMRW